MSVCRSESIEATASSLNLDDSIDQSTSTVQNSNQESANATGDQPTNAYYMSPSELLIDNETNSNPIVISNNVSTNKLQQIKPNSSFENRIVETLSNNENVFSYVSSPSTNGNFQIFQNLPSPISNTTTAVKSNKNLPTNTQYEYLNLGNASPNKISAPNKVTPIDDLIEFRLNGSTTFSKFFDKATSNSNSNQLTMSTPSSNQINNHITQTPSTTTTTVSIPSVSISGLANDPTDSMPELYAPLSSLSSFANSIAQQQKHKLNLAATTTTSKNMPLNNSLSNQSAPEHHAPSTTNSENRLRWINNYNRNKMPAYPPKQPNPGIPSGFRNPLGTPNTLPPSNINVPSGMINGVSTPPINSINSGKNSAAYLNPSKINNVITNSGTGTNNNPNINLASIANSLLSPNNIHQPAGFGGSSLNPTGFPYPTANNLIGPPSIFASAGYPTHGLINPNLSPEVEAEIEVRFVCLRFVCLQQIAIQDT